MRLAATFLPVKIDGNEYVKYNVYLDHVKDLYREINSLESELQSLKKPSDLTKKELNGLRVIHRCRRCGKEFQETGVIRGGMQTNGVDVPVGPVYLYHLCKDGIYGLGDLIGAYEVKNEH